MSLLVQDYRPQCLWLCLYCQGPFLGLRCMPGGHTSLIRLPQAVYPRTPFHDSSPTPTLAGVSHTKSQKLTTSCIVLFVASDRTQHTYCRLCLSSCESSCHRAHCVAPSAGAIKTTESPSHWSITWRIAHLVVFEAYLVQITSHFAFSPFARGAPGHRPPPQQQILFPQHLPVRDCNESRMPIPDSQ